MSTVRAEARNCHDGTGTFFVFFEDPSRNLFGSRGWGLTKEQAEDLARRLRDGEESP